MAKGEGSVNSEGRRGKGWGGGRARLGRPFRPSRPLPLLPFADPSPFALRGPFALCSSQTPRPSPFALHPTPHPSPLTPHHSSEQSSLLPFVPRDDVARPAARLVVLRAS